MGFFDGIGKPIKKKTSKSSTKGLVSYVSRKTLDGYGIKANATFVKAYNGHPPKIYIEERYRNNKAILYHEKGHYVYTYKLTDRQRNYWKNLVSRDYAPSAALNRNHGNSLADETFACMYAYLKTGQSGKSVLKGIKPTNEYKQAMRNILSNKF